MLFHNVAGSGRGRRRLRGRDTGEPCIVCWSAASFLDGPSPPPTASPSPRCLQGRPLHHVRGIRATDVTATAGMGDLGTALFTGQILSTALARPGDSGSLVLAVLDALGVTFQPRPA